jgi:hypothetical protein
VFRLLDKTTNNRIAMHVLQLFHSLVVSEDVEVVVAGLPKGSRSEAFGDGEFQGLECLRERDIAIQWFTDKQMNVLRA